MERKTLQIDDVMLKERTEEGADSPQRHRVHRDRVMQGATAAWGADFAEEWESDGDGGLGTSCLPFLFGREAEVRPGFTQDGRRGESGESCLLDGRRAAVPFGGQA
jgi:hypothetical protein